MLHFPGICHSQQTPQAVMLRHRSQAPQSIVKPVRLQYGNERQRIIVGFGLAEMLEQLSPSVLARRMCADFIECRVDHIFSLVVDGHTLAPSSQAIQLIVLMANKYNLFAFVCIEIKYC
jgi:hypothetical protein